MRLFLASASPRRRELLECAGFELVVQAADVDESLWVDEGAEAYVLRLARSKAAAVEVGGVVIAADTVVVFDGVVLGKPVDGEDAVRMLGLLSGRVHEVMTGVCIRRGDVEETWVTITEVEFRVLGDAEIADYVASGDPMDKAGGYGIQGGAMHMVRGIRGSYTNVVGLPLAEVVERLARGVIPPENGGRLK